MTGILASDWSEHWRQHTMFISRQPIRGRAESARQKTVSVYPNWRRFPCKRQFLTALFVQKFFSVNKFCLKKVLVPKIMVKQSWSNSLLVKNFLCHILLSRLVKTFYFRSYFTLLFFLLLLQKLQQGELLIFRLLEFENNDLKVYDKVTKVQGNGNNLYLWEGWWVLFLLFFHARSIMIILVI